MVDKSFAVLLRQDTFFPLQIAMSKTAPRYAADVQRHVAEEVLLHRRPIAQVARQLRCSPQSVKNWIEKYQSHPPVPPHTTFLPLQVGDAGLPVARIEFVMKNGSTLRFPFETPPETLCAIVQRLEVSSC